METTLPVAKGYWLRHCEGFRVDAPGGSLGFVEEVLFDESGEVPEALVVVEGASGAVRLLVPIDQVAVVQPGRERVSLESSPADIRVFAELSLRARHARASA